MTHNHSPDSKVLNILKRMVAELNAIVDDFYRDEIEAFLASLPERR